MEDAVSDSDGFVIPASAGGRPVVRGRFEIQPKTGE